MHPTHADTSKAFIYWHQAGFDLAPTKTRTIPGCRIETTMTATLQNRLTKHGILAVSCSAFCLMSIPVMIPSPMPVRGAP